MRIKRLKKLRVNSTVFNIKWEKDHSGGSFKWVEPELTIGTRDGDNRTFEVLCHELFEICCTEMHVRHSRQDCDSDFIFVYDHRQHDTISNMFAGLLAQFIE